MAEMIFIRPDNYSLIETMDLFTDDRRNQPLAIVAKLQPVIFEQRPQPQTVQQVIFGHNTNSWTAASCIEEGLIRPSAVDPTDLSWLPAVGFYARVGVFLEFGTLRIVVSLTSCCELRKMPVMERIDLFVWSDWQLVVRRMLPFIKEVWFLSTVPTYFVISFIHKRRSGGPFVVIWVDSHMLPCYCHPSCRVASPDRLATTILGTQV